MTTLELKELFLSEYENPDKKCSMDHGRFINEDKFVELEDINFSQYGTVSDEVIKQVIAELKNTSPRWIRKSEV
ncbi:MAG: hypothetical protein PUI24_01155 [Spirochaetales bacterium]|nr:hypothetical protein [Spirochaetales bacterium]MDD7610506.1 hypothetical protein [Spirochaetales bacterium]MDY5915232.1 hypothetical protein [Treponema sp.]